MEACINLPSKIAYNYPFLMRSIIIYENGDARDALRRIAVLARGGSTEGEGMDRLNLGTDYS